jgi:molybdopterin converting factor small subunit
VVLADLVGGRREIAVAMDGDEATIGQVLDVVGGVHPVLVRSIRDESGELRRQVNVYADGVDIRTLKVENTPVRDGAVVLVLPSVAGG